MSEAIHHQFERLIRALLRRDGVERNGSLVARLRSSRVAKLGGFSVISANGYLIAQLYDPEAIKFPAQIQVYNTLDDEYSIPHMTALIPKLERVLILEVLSDV